MIDDLIKSINGILTETKLRKNLDPQSKDLILLLNDWQENIEVTKGDSDVYEITGDITIQYQNSEYSEAFELRDKIKAAFHKKPKAIQTDKNVLNFHFTTMNVNIPRDNSNVINIDMVFDLGYCD